MCIYATLWGNNYQKPYLMHSASKYVYLGHRLSIEADDIYTVCMP